ncbi:MAG: hypothetical protein U9N60_06970 [Thermodesulfobacteriota bacterium]|nr:hypothetical protein [Thermodesulfobacteriota bacterium]
MSWSLVSLTGFVRQPTGILPLANQRFKEEIAAMLGRRVTLGKAGRPRKKTEKKEGDG